MPKWALYLLLLFPSIGFSDGSRNFRAGTSISAGNVNNITTGDFTICAYVKTTEDATFDSYITKINPLAGANTGYRLSQDTTDNNVARVTDTTGATITCSSTLDWDGIWVDVCGVWNGASNVLTLYENGALVCTSAATPIGSLTNTGNFLTGASGIAAQVMNGLISHVRFYERVLTPVEISETKIRPDAVFPNVSRRSYWPTWGQSGNSEKDMAPPNITGTVTGATTDLDAPAFILMGGWML